jgi:hypothetical protein
MGLDRRFPEGRVEASEGDILVHLRLERLTGHLRGARGTPERICNVTVAFARGEGHGFLDQQTSVGIGHRCSQRFERAPCFTQRFRVLFHARQKVAAVGVGQGIGLRMVAIPLRQLFAEAGGLVLPETVVADRCVRDSGAVSEAESVFDSPRSRRRDGGGIVAQLFACTPGHGHGQACYERSNATDAEAFMELFNLLFHSLSVQAVHIPRLRVAAHTNVRELPAASPPFNPTNNDRGD